MVEQDPVDGEPPLPQPGDLGAGQPPGAAPEDPAARALEAEAAEIRRLVEAGARSPDELRELAARLREHRAREEARWRAEVRPVLRKEGKGRLRGTTSAAVPPADPASTRSHALALAGLAVALVLLVVIAANTTVWLLVLPLVAVLVWAWMRGRDQTT